VLEAFGKPGKIDLVKVNAQQARRILDQRLRRDWNVDEQFPKAVAAINRVAEGLPAQPARGS
jgi:hypothetical protein